MRNSKEIKKWMIDAEQSVGTIAKELDVDQSLVSRTISGEKNNRRVLRDLLGKGCPASYLDLPADMEEAHELHDFIPGLHLPVSNVRPL